MLSISLARRTDHRYLYVERRSTLHQVDVDAVDGESRQAVREGGGGGAGCGAEGRDAAVGGGAQVDAGVGGAWCLQGVLRVLQQEDEGLQRLQHHLQLCDTRNTCSILIIIRLFI